MYQQDKCERNVMVALWCAVLTAPAGAQVWSANEVQLLHGTRYQEPYNPNPVSKRILTLQHASGYEWGRVFGFVDMLDSNAQERNLSGQPESPQEIYGEGYVTVSLSHALQRNLSVGIIKDVGLTVGVNAGNKNSQLHPNPRVYLAGVTVDFAVPRGFFNVDVLGYRDNGCYQGIQQCPDYHATYQITPAWAVPFTVGNQAWEFTGFADFIGSRGQDTVAQILTQPQIRVDLGKHWGQPGRLYAGIEYQYWRNKFGVQGVNEHHPQALLAVKF